MRRRTEVVKSSELRTGDIVLCHGMRVLLDREISCNPHTPNAATYGPVYYSLGRVLNREQVSHASVPYGFTRREGETDHRWQVQGNDNATWYVERA